MAGGSVPGVKGALFKKAVQVKLDQLHATGKATHLFWDKLVFRKVCTKHICYFNILIPFVNKIQAVLGGRIMLLSTGSAPISVEVMDFLKIAFSCEVAEGESDWSPIVTQLTFR